MEICLKLLEHSLDLYEQKQIIISTDKDRKEGGGGGGGVFEINCYGSALRHATTSSSMFQVA